MTHIYILIKQILMLINILRSGRRVFGKSAEKNVCQWTEMADSNASQVCQVWTRAPSNFLRNSSRRGEKIWLSKQPQRCEREAFQIFFMIIEKNWICFLGLRDPERSTQEVEWNWNLPGAVLQSDALGQGGRGTLELLFHSRTARALYRN